MTFGYLRVSPVRALRGVVRSAAAMLVLAGTAFAADAADTPAPAVAAAQSKPRCKAPRELLHFKAPIERFAEVYRRGEPIRVAALGSSSTAGTGASSPKACYPAQLEAELSRRFPGKQFSVKNLGVGGQLARDMLPRIDSEVLPLKPALVIWQTGVNDAIQDVGLAAFHGTLTRGVDKIRAQGIDVVLLDMQYYPKAEKMAHYLDYLRVMRQVAKEKNIPILHRFDIMKHLIASSQFRIDQLLSPDSFHQNDLSYGCLSDLLADAIQDDLTRTLGSTGAIQ